MGPSRRELSASKLVALAGRDEIARREREERDLGETTGRSSP
jgi:hypothetical protein